LIVSTDDSKQQLKSWQRETTSISKCHKAVVVEGTMPLLHYQQFLVVGVAFLAVWYILLQRHHTAESVLITYLPLWGIVCLGLYALSSVIYGTLNFKDTPEASRELERQIQDAKQEMTKRGIIKPNKKNQ
jgi:dolichyl-phosphate mannosyltransferase polypeptide 3